MPAGCLPSQSWLHVKISLQVNLQVNLAPCGWLHPRHPFLTVARLRQTMLSLTLQWVQETLGVMWHRPASLHQQPPLLHQLQPLQERTQCQSPAVTAVVNFGPSCRLFWPNLGYRRNRQAS